MCTVNARSCWALLLQVSSATSSSSSQPAATASFSFGGTLPAITGGRFGHAFATLQQSLTLPIETAGVKQPLGTSPTVNPSYSASGELLSPDFGDNSGDDDLASVQLQTRYGALALMQAELSRPVLGLFK